MLALPQLKFRFYAQPYSHLTREEREPRNGKHDHDDNEHAHDALFLKQTALALSFDVRRLADRAPDPEGVSDLAVRQEHGEHWGKIEQEIDGHRVGGDQARVTDVFGTHLNIHIMLRK